MLLCPLTVHVRVRFSHAKLNLVGLGSPFFLGLRERCGDEFCFALVGGGHLHEVWRVEAGERFLVPLFLGVLIQGIDAFAFVQFQAANRLVADFIADQNASVLVWGLGGLHVVLEVGFRVYYTFLYTQTSGLPHDSKVLRCEKVGYVR